MSDSWQLIEHYMLPIKHLLDTPGVSEICINKFDEIFIEKNGQIEKTESCFQSEHQVATLIKCIGNALGQPCSEYTNPVLDARLNNGARICGVLYPTATKGSNLTIRLFSKQKLDLKQLIPDIELYEYLKKAISTKANVLVSGGTGSGKTTLLNALLEHVDTNERVITVEDTQELNINVKNLIHLEAPVRKDDNKSITLSSLIKTTLRMKPNRIVVGEIRDSEAAFSFLQAINTGHCSLSTIHANHPADAISRMQTLIASAVSSSIPFEAIEKQLLSNVNLIIQTAQLPTGRRIISVTEVSGNQLLPLWQWSNKKQGYLKKYLDKSRILEIAESF